MFAKLHTIIFKLLLPMLFQLLAGALHALTLHTRVGRCLPKMLNNRGEMLHDRCVDDLLELVKVDLRVTVVVGEGEHPRDRAVLHLRVHLPNGGLELAGVDIAVATGVDGPKDSAQLLLSELAAAGAVDGRLRGNLCPRGEHLARVRARVRVRVSG